MRHGHEDEDEDETYPVGRLMRLVYSLHHTALLISHIAHPVRLAGADEQMRAPALDLPVEHILGVDLEAARVLDGAAVAVVQALVAVDGGIRLVEELREPRRSLLGAAAAPEVGGEGLERHGHSLLDGHAWQRRRRGRRGRRRCRHGGRARLRSEAANSAVAPLVTVPAVPVVVVPGR